MADPSWHSAIAAGLLAMHQRDGNYFNTLIQSAFLPARSRLFAAFRQPMSKVRYILIGEGPYPREESATGVCFMDGAVSRLWAEDGSGLSKKVNRATSLRNFIKMLLVAAGALDPAHTSGSALQKVSSSAIEAYSPWIQQLAELQQHLHEQGFLLLNASLVFRSEVAPAKDGKAWQPFLQEVLSAIAEHAARSGTELPSLILWGKIAEQLRQIPVVADFPHIIAEHPYNLSFIRNETMQALFYPMHLLSRHRS
ncbi:uracil-DNA glycosylase [Undibacterium oligocarboniphilum]|uniref:Uracil-DNA glycosylase n=2 Tax=Undibacterium oligocarboniphilum TaxID=666702 RepID=A0A850QL00_9BURK|nr:uracil-DNA glycosylase [Undibacterium oligocarboniphilum]NVO78215.1 uracil-DNA glycosylase [Undibacterium oligocarboniphilum]